MQSIRSRCNTFLACHPSVAYHFPDPWWNPETFSDHPPIFSLLSQGPSAVSSLVPEILQAKTHKTYFETHKLYFESNYSWFKNLTRTGNWLIEKTIRSCIYFSSPPVLYSRCKIRAAIMIWFQMLSCPQLGHAQLKCKSVFEKYRN